MTATYFAIAALFLALSASPVHAQVPLSKRAFETSALSDGTVIMQINWGRYWKCGPYENAQLQRLTFRRLTDSSSEKPKDWELSSPSALLAKPSFIPYAYLLEPGEYALSSVRIKVAASASDVRVADVDSSQLIVDGQPIGGSFTVAAGEIVYIGHFGVDCAGEPTPWRFYIEGKEEFDSYTSGFRKRFPFVNEAPVIFRLFKTDTFGKPYDLPQ